MSDKSKRIRELQEKSESAARMRHIVLERLTDAVLIQNNASHARINSQGSSYIAINQVMFARLLSFSAELAGYGEMINELITYLRCDKLPTEAAWVTCGTSNIHEAVRKILIDSKHTEYPDVVEKVAAASFKTLVEGVIYSMDRRVEEISEECAVIYLAAQHAARGVGRAIHTDEDGSDD